MHQKKKGFTKLIVFKSAAAKTKEKRNITAGQYKSRISKQTRKRKRRTTAEAIAPYNQTPLPRSKQTRKKMH
jgi:hypothetical protein